MQLTDKQIDLINRQKLAVLSTANLGNEPRAVFVEINKTNGDELVITDNHMEITKNNILENKNVFVLVGNDDLKWGVKISGEAKYYNSGEYFDMVKSLATNKYYQPKGAVVIKIVKINEF